MADQLGALGEVVTDRTLVFHVIRGLSERFKNVGMHLRHGRPFPTFIDAKADLLLEELTMGPQAPSQATALAASSLTPPRACALGWHQLRGRPCFIVQEPPQQAQRQKWRLWTAAATVAERRAALQRPAKSYGCFTEVHFCWK